MKTFLKILVLTLLIPAFTYAANMNASLKVYRPLAVTVVSHIVMPSAYTTDAGAINSEGTTSIPGGQNGANAELSITGHPNKVYSLSFATTVDITNGTDTLTIALAMGTGEGTKTGRTMPVGGTDTPSIKGSVTLPGTLSDGDYANASPVAVTATYDAV
ncbi:MAG: hypothetical protein V1647_03585 [Pseudomonadota bacterium]